MSSLEEWGVLTGEYHDMQDRTAQDSTDLFGTKQQETSLSVKVDVEKNEGFGTASQAVSGRSFKSQKTDSAEITISRVEDFEEIEPNYLVDEALEQCKRFLSVYYIGIKILGWTQLTEKNGQTLRIIRWCLVFFWNLLLILTFTVQSLTCSTRNRFHPLREVPNSSPPQWEVNCSYNQFILCILGDILVLVTYWFGLHLFSREEKEYTLNLAEKTFIKLTTNHDASTKPVIRSIWAFCFVFVIWIVFSVCVRVLNMITVRLYEPQVIIDWSNTSFNIYNETKIVLVTTSFAGFTVYDFVYFIAITNYTVQGELIIHLTRSVKELVNRKQYVNMDATAKDVGDIRKKVCKLNGKTSAVAAMALMIVALSFYDACDNLVDLRSRNHFLKDKHLAIVTAVLQIIYWIVPLLLPFIQAARVSYQCDKLKQTGIYLRTRPFQYCKTPQPELDSYLIFIQATKLRATMCGIPIHPRLPYAVLLIAVFLFVIFFQMDDYDVTKFVN